VLPVPPVRFAELVVPAAAERPEATVSRAVVLPPVEALPEVIGLIVRVGDEIYAPEWQHLWDGPRRSDPHVLPVEFCRVSGADSESTDSTGRRVLRYESTAALPPDVQAAHDFGSLTFDGVDGAAFVRAHTPK